ncbi:MAG TPA: MBL fold metallo-hydrolase [Peptococcaceae bacterium]|nr:MAG: Metal-dependent hydrolase [Clostridia bacterium 41_269]HBT20372.1 MBL fold metallo-hydrolase [Peptococcaceae bacterium]
MRIQVLGCWAPYPRADQACSGYLLSAGGKNILLDLGHGAFGKLVNVFNYLQLDAVFISHLHMDHCADLSCLRHAILGCRRLGKIDDNWKLPLFIPKEPQQMFEIFSDYNDVFEITPIDSFLSGQNIKMGSAALDFLSVEHPIPTYGIKVLDEEEGKKFVYSSDTAYMEELVDFAKEADIFLCEASLLERDSQYIDKGHLTSKLAGKLAEEAQVRKLILTHFWPEYNLKDLTAEAEETFTGQLETAEQFKVYSC